ncbi:MAG: flagellar hook-basal body complex protein FliE [Firmicutes bacterium]|nr:flagellar hook-basal body complex protein FliE [Bacillota bacterium]
MLSIQGVSPAVGAAPRLDAGGSVSLGSSFAQILDKLQGLQQQADTVANQWAAGAPVSLDQVLLNSQQASLALSAAAAIENRALSAYQQMMQMQI